MKKFAIVALAVLAIAGVARAERTALSIDGEITIMGIYNENITALGNTGVDNRVEQQVKLNVDADMTDNIKAHIGLEANGSWADDSGVTANTAQLGTNWQSGLAGNPALGIEEAYISVDELFMEQLKVTVGIQNIEYSLRDDGNAMFLSYPEAAMYKGTWDYDPLFVDFMIAKLDEVRNTVAAGTENDTDLYALAIEYYLENDSKVQVILFNINNESGDTSMTEYSAGVDYKGIENLEIFVQLGGQSGDVADVDASTMAYNLGAEYTFANVNYTPYVGLSYQSFGGDDTDNSWIPTGDVDETIVLEADRDLRDHNLNGSKILATNYNVIRIVAGCVVNEKTTVDGGIGIFSKTEEDAAATMIGAAADSAIGTEIDVQLAHQFTDDLSVGVGVGYVASGDGIEDTGGESDPIIGMYASAKLDF
jgi:hypothetical protein